MPWGQGSAGLAGLGSARALTRVPPLSPQGRGSGGLLHLPGHLLGHRLVPLWVHLLFCLEEAKMPQLWRKLYLKGTAHPAPHAQLPFSDVNVVYNSFMGFSFRTVL